ncbi:MAG TPA: tRNA (guanosine(46)-N7)-methyltransferase TrmB [Candidatus Syntrophosphaera sp.]|nr:tRNA (guanosine(46)-N7)-methyltransferase TrmB [Candidatus Syntrophosphaera sp.]
MKTMPEDWAQFVVEGKDAALDPAELFGNAQPLYIEIGSGKGEFISQYPLQHPQYNFLGFEARDKRIRNILKKLSPERHPNVRVVRLMVDANLAQALPESSVSGAFIQHPDPWPKKRHHKRRLFQQDFLNALATVLMPDALVHVSTDHAEYAAWIAEAFLRNPRYISVFDPVIGVQPSLDDHVRTWYEAEQQRQGYAPNFMCFRRL